ncbi:MurR/RpiR family transcriptional regulator [Spiroplasma alleghenense]|uniref:MurR/RpiR family transcriptional regulator n=1 Tax=Spiroplasma alleghenense TaxID=216931 RepID=A0A345Z527_9MOLU|nr:MurR/RpiR family transcriptional regulator [Spiroplasma alleghenense]AXK51706.1 MurR/RpiR family transcriptional regulator [Spiroplasma alleghenense]
MKNENFLLKMKEISNNNFKTIDYVIYKFILDYPDKVSNFTLNEFSAACFVSKPTVLKFCQKIGLTGFSELKFHIKNNLNLKDDLSSELTVAKEFRNTNKFKEKYLNLSNAYAQNIINNFDVLDEQILQLLNHINHSNIIYIFCANLAYYASKNFVQRVRFLNKNIILESDINLIESYISSMPKEAMVIIISLSGLNPHILQMVNWIEAKNYTFALTGVEGQISSKSDNFFLIPQDENDLWDNYSLRSQFVVGFFDLLYIELFNSSNEYE